jgi:hypothetical protein
MTSGSLNMLSYDSFVDDLVQNELENVLQRVDDEISAHHVKEMDIPLTSQIIMAKLKLLVNLALFPHDGTIEAHGMNAVLEETEANLEPAPIVIDPWARGIGNTGYMNMSIR